MGFIDLHMHSTYSDGRNTPSELIEYAKEKDLAAIALTDHDTTDGLKEAREKSEQLGIEFVNGVEINSYYYLNEKKVFIHVLGYMFAPEKLEGFMAELKKLRYEHNRKIADALCKIGIPIDYNELTNKASTSMITRMNFAHELVEKGYAQSYDEALKKYLHKGGAAYVEYILYPFSIVAQKIHEAGGIVCLAHPAEYELNDLEILDMIQSLKSEGLDGIECIHPSENAEYSAYMMNLVKKYNLITTGGSDFHGREEEDIDLGAGYAGMRIPESFLDKLNKIKYEHLK